MRIGTYIWQRRMELDIAQKDLAATVEISAQYLSDIEHNRREVQQPALIERFAAALHVNPDILYFHAGLLAPDMYAAPWTEERITAAFAAMRSALTRS